MTASARPTPASQEGAPCRVCGSTNVAGARFCGTCGTRLLFFCWSCGTLAAVGQLFCQSCGMSLALPAGAVAAAGAESAGHSISAAGAGLPLAASLPAPDVAAATAGTVGLAAATSTPASPAVPPIMEWEDDAGSEAFAESDDAEGEEPLVEERRIVSVLFADIVGFTTLSERLDPEDVRELSASVLARLAEAVAVYGGTIDKFMGDAVMALFGAPVAHEDDPVRAVHAALAMHQAVAALGQLDRDGNELELRLRIGINSGEVIAGVRDVGGHREYSVFGDVVNTAARLQTAAVPGGTLLGEETARQAGGVFELAAVEPLVLKGKAQPVAAYEVRGSLTRQLPALGPASTDRKLPLAGRLLELQELRRQIGDLSRGRGQLTAIIGEHGVGKSRLLAEAREYGEELGLHWVEAAAPSHAQGLSYRLIREVLMRLLNLRPARADDRLVAALSQKLKSLGRSELLPPLGLVMGAETGADGIDGLTAQQLQRRVLDATGHLLGALVSESPIVLVLDALQWADPSSIDVLVELMGLSDDAPILFVFVFTPEPDAPSWQLKEQAARGFPHRYTEMTLGPLPERAARELMCSLLSCADTPAHVEDLVLERTDGNPFFIEEVLRALIDSGALRYDGDRWVADGDVHELEIPNTLLATVMARIDRLPASVRRTLQIAAVIGREVSERVLRRVTDGGPELDRSIREALRAGLLREEAAIPERRYAFTQSLIHDAALRSLLIRRRREIHVQVGWALEEIFADNLEQQYGELARHFWEGESWERAFRYSRLAAEQAAAAFANDEAVAAFTMALESAERSAAGGAPEVVAALAERRADVRALIGEYELALDDYRSVIAYLLEQLKDGADEADEAAARRAGSHVGALALKMARLHSYRGEVEATREKLELAFKKLPPDSPDLGSAWSLKATLYVWATDTAAAADAARSGLAIARERGTPQHLAEAYEALTHPTLIGALGPELSELADDWVRLARERPEDRPVLFKALTARGLIRVWVDWTFDEAIRAEILEALEIARATGSTAAENTARGILGAGELLIGEWDDAEAELRRSAGQATTLAGVGAIYEWWLMLLLTLRGQLQPAADQMVVWLEDRGNNHRQILMRALLGLNRLLAGDDAGARAAIDGAVEIASGLGCEQCSLTLNTIAAEVLAQLGDAEGATSHAALARDAGTRFGRPVAVLAADRADALVALQQGRVDAARRLMDAALPVAEQLGQPYELARTLLLAAEAGTAGGAAWAVAPHRQRARAILDGLGVPPDLRVVRTTSGPPLQV
jgi:class 3 adenylate cyclase